MTDFTNNDDIIDVRDIIARVEELREELRGEVPDSTAWEGTEQAEELQALENLLEKLKGNGGGTQWAGAWYPVTLIHDLYFKDYAEELAEDIGAINRGTMWPNNCIDWERAARELQQDYSTIDYDGETYWYR